MQDLNTWVFGSNISSACSITNPFFSLHVLRFLGSPSKDPAKTLRTYAQSILETPERQERTLVNPRTPSPLPSSNGDPNAPLSLEERRALAKTKVRLQRNLLQAARVGDELDATLLLSESAETEWTESHEGKTAHLIAAQYSHIEVAEILLDAGADIEARSDAFGDDWVICTEKGRTPLIWAASGRDCHYMQERMCKFLVDKGADVNARNVFGRTALQELAMSVRFNNIDPRSTMEYLLQRGAHVNACHMNSWTALTECAHYGKNDVAELLLRYGAQVDGRPPKDDPASESNPEKVMFRETPLVICAEWSWNEELVCLLLEKGADTQGTNKEGKKMADLASEARRGVVLDELEKVEKLRRGEVQVVEGRMMRRIPYDGYKGGGMLVPL